MEYVLKTDKGVRAFLNDVGVPHNGSVHGSLEVNATGRHCYGELAIFDCTRSVALSFDFEDMKTWKEGMCKLDRMVEALEHFRDLYRAAKDVADKIEWRKNKSSGGIFD